MAKFSVGSLEEGEGSSSRDQKRQRIDRQPQTDSIETVVEEIYDGDEETRFLDQDFVVFLSNQEVIFQEEQEQNAGSGEEEEEEEAVNNPGDEEMDDPVVEPGKNETVSVILTDPEVFDCPICCEPLSTLVFQCENGHIACSTCCTKIMNKCPSCCLPIGYNRCRAIEKVLESIKVKCQNTKYGCKETMNFNKKLVHAKTCHHVPCSCPMSDCNFVGSCTQLYKHFRDEHKNLAVQFQLNKGFQFTLNFDDTFLVLLEEKDGLLFILNNKIESVANIISVCCIAPSAKEGFHYSILAKSGGSIITFHSCTKNIQSQIDDQPSSRTLLLPADSFGNSGRLKLEICIRQSR